MTSPSVTLSECKNSSTPIAKELVPDVAPQLLLLLTLELFHALLTFRIAVHRVLLGLPMDSAPTLFTQLRNADHTVLPVADSAKQKRTINYISAI